MGRKPAGTRPTHITHVFLGRYALCFVPRGTKQAGYSSVGRASDCRARSDQMVPGSIPGGRTFVDRACAGLEDRGQSHNHTPSQDRTGDLQRVRLTS